MTTLEAASLSRAETTDMEAQVEIPQPAEASYRPNAGNTDDPAVLTLSGEIDSIEVGKLTPEVDELLRRRPTALVIDLSEVSFLDSSGIALLIRIANAVPSIELHGVSPTVRRVIELTGLAETLPIAR